MGRYLDRAEQFLRTLAASAAAEEAPLPNLSEGPTGPIPRPDASRATAVADDLPPDAEEGALYVGSLCPVCRAEGKIAHLRVRHHGTWRCWRCLRRDPERFADRHQTPDARHCPEALQAQDDALEVA